MKLHLISENIVRNIILFDGTFEQAQAAYPEFTVVDADVHPGAIGQTHDPVHDTFTNTIVAPVVPLKVTRTQALKALYLAGISEATILAVINAIPDATMKAFATIEFQNSA